MKSATMKRSSFLSGFRQYFVSFLLITFTTAIFFALRDVLDTTLIALLYLIPLGVITAFWGLGPGITNALLSFLAFNYFFIPPYYTLAVHRSTDVVILIVFLIVAIVISQLVGRMKTSLAAATAREREATQLYELSTALASLLDDHAIAEILAKQVQAVSRGDALELDITGPQPFIYGCLNPAYQPAHQNGSSPCRWRAVFSGRFGFGGLRQPSRPDEKRLLQTFASQGALALERARLAQAESRAKSPRR